MMRSLTVVALVAPAVLIVVWRQPGWSARLLSIAGQSEPPWYEGEWVADTGAEVPYLELHTAFRGITGRLVRTRSANHARP
jgi:hypothetical protein